MIEPPKIELQDKLKVQLESRILYALRFLVSPPIKGEITKGKMRWRGLYLNSVLLNSGELFDAKLQPDGSMQTRYIGNTFAVECEWELSLFQRDHQIPLRFDAETESKYQAWLKEEYQNERKRCRESFDYWRKKYVKIHAAN